MPITFNQVYDLGDQLSADRWVLSLPDVPGGNSADLSILASSVALPEIGSGNVIVKIMNTSTAFRGGLEFQNVMTITFHESVKGVAIRTLMAWLQLVRDENTGGGLPKTNYAKNAKVALYDTAGKKVHDFTLVNLWPLSIQLPEFNEESAAIAIPVQFALDRFILENGEYRSPAEMKQEFPGLF